MIIIGATVISLGVVVALINAAYRLGRHLADNTVAAAVTDLMECSIESAMWHKRALDAEAGPKWQQLAKLAHDLEVAEHIMAVHGVNADTPAPSMPEGLEL